MNKPVYAVLYSLLGITLFFGLSTIYSSCGGKKAKVQNEDSLSDKVEDVADTYTGDDYFEDDEGSVKQSEDPDEVPTDNSTNRESNDVADTRKTQSYERTPPSPRVYSGRYMVIAGNYLLESNADIMVKRLKDSGYGQSEKVVFDLSQYYTVIAGSYDSKPMANSISSELSAKGIDNYVLSRKE